MKFRCDRDVLSEALQTVQRGVSPRPGLPALTGVLMEVADGTLTLSTTDLEVSARLAVDVQAQEPGIALVPARRKFLRSTRAEFAACMDVVKRLAMARPEVAFSVEHDGRRILSVAAAEDRPERVAALTDRALADNSVAIDLEREGHVLGGVAGLPTFHRGVADHQYLFVNGRPVKDRLLMGAIRGAYAEMLPRDRHAVVALFLDVPPAVRPLLRLPHGGGRRAA